MDRPAGFPSLASRTPLTLWAKEIRELLQRTSRENPSWGAPRIHGGLSKPPSRTWLAFLDNHVGGLVSIDFLVVPTARFAVLFVFIGGPGGFMGHTCRDLGPEPMLKEELAVTRIYLESLARALNLDLDRACEAKMPMLRKRWPEPPTEAQT